ncbi:hypothetical protein CO112_02455 [Candidatus Dojkabacteria bacterium CG_4_9_14_3_um_filter_150_Dojkabacteria_WS6_41_13]|uniref:OmpR/PhoB-type domain-containing protein n=1 Tax=Candidatus Dojkabacteria bacterium CG_4_10_14_0_2_um_filter_Dojkabacteria_WS6_41_15 TaxID=2014249 RepID=A0A2M7W140_9BACT|nr:MAG: hypothetical protein COZ14_00540 [Candidatus Dojkabacteria bacterium CG_4_10_14_3_um_filter_Dojkabacteria_WS6_41_9]PJA12622.1 MAG: hypothetical protein COX64_04305 [Candidatus Dojkabacteria bacterium CG_4_10_14_0_2_um_filter_Dojkabacteria_WS6_41_15]PJB22788.1 MAG: hypothetical protein CO112_02455 [Candidatus Dojkabacteria bacterium CG_4_9_14_3_um_filter_150_Dojkabacteria_WS6_41_13]
MITAIQGISTDKTPFISTILAPQLRARNMPLYFVASISEVPLIQASYTLLDGEIVLQQPLEIKKQLCAYIAEQSVSMALIMGKSHQQKLALLELGFSHCLELPVATEVIIRTIENSLKPHRTTHLQLREKATNYNTNAQLSYLHDKHGRYFLTNHTKSIYLSINEQKVLEYLLQREGFASKNELSYAGWHNFDTRANTITVTVKKLRKKLFTLRLPYTIRTLYGYGYSLKKSGMIDSIDANTTYYDALVSP